MNKAVFSQPWGDWVITCHFQFEALYYELELNLLIAINNCRNTAIKDIC